MKQMIRSCSLALMACAGAGIAAEWSTPVEVRHEDALCVSYEARLDGPYLVVRTTVGPGWHTFALDNQRRAEEKLAGQPALSSDRATEIKPVSGLATTAPWYQTAPKDFSRPELRMFSWGFDRSATFAAKARRTAGPAKVAIRGQACTETVCKNIDVLVTVPAQAKASPVEIDLKGLVAAR
jgi:DsbC/DsbD-like thiol-disulfide interchange protein